MATTGHRMTGGRPVRRTATERAIDVKVSAWRASRGPQGERWGWSAAEAASLIPMPTRTLMNWRTESLVQPTVDLEQLPRPIYCAGDLLVARMLWDLGEAGVPRSIVSQVGADLHRWRVEDTEAGFLGVRGVAQAGFVVMVPAHPDIVALALEHFPGDGLCSFHEADHAEQLAELGDVVVVYPISDIAAGLVKRIDAWWLRVGTKPDRRPAWM